MAENLQASFVKMHLDEKSTERQQTESPLMNLSAELRNKIYELAACSEPVQIQVDYHVTRPLGSQPPAGVALLMTCRQILREACHLVWDNLRFELEIVPERSECDCPNSRQILGSTLYCPILAKIRNVSISFEDDALSAVERDMTTRDRNLRGLLIDNENIKHLELRSSGWVWGRPGEPTAGWLGTRGIDPTAANMGRINRHAWRSSMVKQSYILRFGTLLQALQERQARVLQYNPTTEQMVETYKIPLTKYNFR